MSILFEKFKAWFIDESVNIDSEIDDPTVGLLYYPVSLFELL